MVNEIDVSKMRVRYDGFIIQDVAAEKARDTAEVGVTMNAWEYSAKWYGEDEETAKTRAQELERNGRLTRKNAPAN